PNERRHEGIGPPPGPLLTGRGEVRRAPGLGPRDSAACRMPGSSETFVERLAAGKDLRLALAIAVDLRLVFDRQRAVVARGAEAGDQRREIDDAAAERGKLERGIESLAVLEVDMGDLVAELADDAHRVLVLDRKVARVEVDPERHAGQLAA